MQSHPWGIAENEVESAPCADVGKVRGEGEGKRTAVGCTASQIAELRGASAELVREDALVARRRVAVTEKVVAAPQQWEGQRFKLHGFVVPNSIGRKENTNTVEYRFDMQRNGKTIRAYYTGIPADQFKDEAEVVLTGVMKGESFHATEMTAKCPSKYEERAPSEVGL